MLRNPSAILSFELEMLIFNYRKAFMSLYSLTLRLIYNGDGKNPDCNSIFQSQNVEFLMTAMHR